MTHWATRTSRTLLTQNSVVMNHQLTESVSIIFVKTPLPRVLSIFYLLNMVILWRTLHPEEGIIKGVFTFDYTKEGDDICIHSFTLSYETAEGITIRNPEVYAVDLARTPVVDNQISLKHLRILSRKPSSNIFFSGSFDYKGEEHSFQIDL